MPAPGLPSRRLKTEVIVEEEDDETLESAFGNLDQDSGTKREAWGEDASKRDRATLEEAAEEAEEEEGGADEGTLREEAKRCAEKYGSTAEETVVALQALAMLLVAQMRWSDAEEVLRSLLHRAESGLGLSHETTLQVSHPPLLPHAPRRPSQV